MVKPRVSIVLLLLLPGLLHAGSRGGLPNAVDLELGGKCLVYSFSYQRMLVEPLGLEAGLALLGGGSSGSSSSVLFVTCGAKLYFAERNASPYIGGGIVGVTASTTSGPFGSRGSGSYGYVTPGFEFRSRGGFLIRGALYILFRDGFYLWPGLSVGIAF